MAYKIGTASNYLNALEILKDFVSNANDVTVATPNPGNTGDGTCSQPIAVDDAPTEDWTLTATSATNFTVVGSISGGQAAATVGIPYNNGIIAFTITAGGTSFVSSDAFTFSVTMVMGDQKWEVLEFNTDYDGSGGYRTYFKGPGSTGTDEIFVGIQTYEDATTPYYNWILGGFTNWQSGLTFFTQQGARQGDSVNLPRMLLDDGAMRYWYVANGRRVMGVLRVGTIYAPFYLGFPLVYGTPSSYPYPLCIGGSAAYSATLADRQWSTTSPIHRGFPDPYISGNYGSFMMMNGIWTTFGNYSGDNESLGVYGNSIWPGNYAECSVYANHSNRLMWWGDSTPDGRHPLFPLIICQKTTVIGILGELEGIFAVHGDGVVSEDDITYLGNPYKNFQNTYHTAPHNYFAMKLE